MSGSSAVLERPAALGWQHLGRALLGFGLAIILLSYVVIAVHAGEPWLWHVVVHEDGRRSLLDTVLYYQHALRELPLDLLLGLMIGASALLVAGPDDGTKDARKLSVVLAVALLGVIAVIVLGALAEIGRRGVVDELLQKPTRDGAPLVTGAHWLYHLVSRFALLLAALGFAGLLGLLSPARSGQMERVGLVIACGTLLLYLLLSAAFTPDLQALRAPFTEPRHLGHQAREVVTHGLVTLPIGLGTCLLLLSRSGARQRLTWSGRGGRAGWIPAALALGALGIVLGAWLGYAALAADATSHGQASDLTTLVFPHVFEHGFTYLVVALTAALVCTSFTPSRRGRP